jgi:hypothetical protein
MPVLRRPGRGNVKNLPVVDAENVPTVAPAQDPGVRVPLQEVAQGFGEQVSNFGLGLMKTQARMRGQEVKRYAIGSERHLKNELSEYEKSFETGGDVGDHTQLKTYFEQINQAEQKLIEAFKGSPEETAFLKDKTSAVAAEFKDQMLLKNRAVIKSDAAKNFYDEADSLQKQLASGNTGLIFDSIDDYYDKNVSDFFPEEADQTFKTSAKRQMATSHVDKLLDSGKIDEAEDFLNDFDVISLRRDPNTGQSDKEFESTLDKFEERAFKLRQGGSDFDKRLSALQKFKAEGVSLSDEETKIFVATGELPDKDKQTKAQENTDNYKAFQNIMTEYKATTGKEMSVQDKQVAAELFGVKIQLTPGQQMQIDIDARNKILTDQGLPPISQEIQDLMMKYPKTVEQKAQDEVKRAETIAGALENMGEHESKPFIQIAAKVLGVTPDKDSQTEAESKQELMGMMTKLGIELTDAEAKEFIAGIKYEPGKKSEAEKLLVNFVEATKIAQQQGEDGPPVADLMRGLRKLVSGGDPTKTPKEAALEAALEGETKGITAGQSKITEQKVLAGTKAGSAFFDPSGNLTKEATKDIENSVGISLAGGDLKTFQLSPANRGLYAIMVKEMSQMLRDGEVQDVAQAQEKMNAKYASEILEGLPKTLLQTADDIIEAQTEIGSGEVTVDEATLNADISKLKVDIEDATGVDSSWKNFINNTIGLLDDSAVDVGVASARTQLKLLSKEFMTILISGGGKAAVWEQKIIKSILNDPNAFESVAAVKVSLRTIEEHLDTQIKGTRQLLQLSEGFMTSANKMDALKDLSNMARFKASMNRFNISTKDSFKGVDFKSFESPQGVQKAARQSLDAFRSSMTPQEMESWADKNPKAFEELHSRLTKGSTQDFEGTPPKSEKAQEKGGAQKSAFAPLTDEIVGRTPEGRIIYRNEDGSVSSERSVGIEMDGVFYNVPTIFGGQEVSVDEAVRMVRDAGMKDPETGLELKKYKTQKSADKAAIAKSNKLGEGQ